MKHLHPSLLSALTKLAIRGGYKMPANVIELEQKRRGVPIPSPPGRPQ